MLRSLLSTGLLVLVGVVLGTSVQQSWRPSVVWAAMAGIVIASTILALTRPAPSAGRGGNGPAQEESEGRPPPA
jgi:hypothetical protein